MCTKLTRSAHDDVIFRSHLTENWARFYFKVEDAPRDLVGGEDESDDMPEEMRRELRSLGLL